LIIITCYIPKELNEVSTYVLRIIEDRLEIKFDIRSERRISYKFEYKQSSFDLQAKFVTNEYDNFLKKRVNIQYSLAQYIYINKVYLGIQSNENHEKEKIHQIDIIGTIFILLSRYEEYILTKVDNFDHLGRFKASKAINKDYLNRPIVDELICLFKSMIENEFSIRIAETESKYKIIPSHDVDRPFEYLYYSKRHLLKRMAGDLISRRSFLDVLKRHRLYKDVQNGSLSRDPYNTFDWIIKSSVKHDRKNIFFFLTYKTNKKYDQEYSITNPEIQTLLLKINNAGHEIGLHPSFNSSLMSGQVQKEAEILIAECEKIGININTLRSRYHYLRWNNKSVEELENANIVIDQTLTFAEYPGFRCGTCKCYPAFNFQKLEASKVMIEPLIIMEQSLFSKSYLGLKDRMEDAWNVVVELRDQCRQHNGNFTLLWHNNQLVEPKMREFYEQCIT